MDDNIDCKPLADESPSHTTSNLTDDSEDSELVLPPYPDYLPSPLDEHESHLSSPLEDRHDTNNGKNREPVSKPIDIVIHAITREDELAVNPSEEFRKRLENIANRTSNTGEDKRVSFKDVIKSSDKESKIRSESNCTVNQPERQEWDMDRCAGPIKDVSLNDQSVTISDNNGDTTRAGSETGRGRQMRPVSFNRISPPETKFIPQAKSESRTDNNIAVIPVGDSNISTMQNEQQDVVPMPKDCQQNRPVTSEHYMLAQKQDAKTNASDSNTGTSKELWPPVPSIEDIDMDITAHLGELDKFCKEYGKDESEQMTQLSPVPGLEGTSSNQFMDQRPTGKDIQIPLQKLQHAKLTNYQSLEKGSDNGQRTGSVELQSHSQVAELYVTQEDQRHLQDSNRKFNIPLSTGDREVPEQNFQDLGQHRRERYAQSKGPFWKQSRNGEPGYSKAETPMMGDFLGDDAEDDDFQLNRSQKIAEQTQGKNSMDDAAIIKNDFIIIQVGGDHDRDKEQKIVDIVNQLRRLPSLDQVLVEGTDAQNDDDTQYGSLPSGSGSLHRDIPQKKREKSRFATVSSRIISDGRARGRTDSSGSARRVQGTTPASQTPLRRGISFQQDSRRAERRDLNNVNRPTASSSLGNLVPRRSQGQQNGKKENGVSNGRTKDLHSGDQTPSSDNEVDMPKAKTNHKGSLFERFDFKRNRPHSDEITSSHKFMKFLNLTNGSQPEPETKLITSPGETESPELLRHLQQGNVNGNGLPSTLATGQTNDAFEDESQLSGDELVMELLRLSGKNVGAMSGSTNDSADDSETPVDETTPLTSNQHRRQRSITFFDEAPKERMVDFDSICEEVDETCPLRGSVVPPDPVYSDDITTDDGFPGADDFMNEEYDNLSLEFVVPGSKKHIRLHRQTFIKFVLKYSIFLFSFMFWSASLSGLTFGTWMMTRKTVVFNNASDVMLDPHVLLCLVGGIIFLVAFLGCIGALRENILLLRMFHISLTAVLALEGFLTTLIFIFYTLPEFRAAAKVGPEEVLKKAVIRYFDDAAMREWIDNLQKEFKCCGVSLRDNGYLDWTENMYFNCSDSNPSVYRCSVPLSCCIFEPGDYINYMCGIGIVNKDMPYVKRYINTKGCMKSFGEWLAANTSLIAYVGLAFFIPQILGVVAARFFITNLKKQQQRQINAVYDNEEDDDEDDIKVNPPASGATTPVAAAAAAVAGGAGDGGASAVSCAETDF